jgi:hydrogenase maturation factor
MIRKIKFREAGKIPNKYLDEIVFKYLGFPNKRVIYGPSIGRDAAAIKLSDDKIVIVKSDPITGSVKNIGRYSVIINANDIVVLGAIPLFFLSTILLPINSSLEDLEVICKDIDQAAKELNISVVGGHSEVSAGIKEPILCGSMIGETTSDSVITANSKPGDKLIMTKSAAIEGTSILAWDREEYLKDRIDNKILSSAKKFTNSLSILKEAQLVLQIGGITAMHDPTEGGIMNGIFELCEASNVGAEIYKELIPIARETREICDIFDLNPLRLISSGTLLMSVEDQKFKQILKILTSNGIVGTCIGEIKEDKAIKLLKKGAVEELITDQNQDQLWKVITD